MLHHEALALMLALFGILPFYNARTKTFEPKVIYSIALVTADAFVSLYAIYILTYSEYNVVTMFYALLIPSAVQHAVSSYSFTFAKAKVLQDTLDLLLVIDESFGRCGKLIFDRKHPTVTFTTTNIAFWIAIFVQVSLCIEAKGPLDVVDIQTLQCYALIMTAWVSNIFLYKVRVRFSALNQVTGETCSLEGIEVVSKLHVQLCNVVDNANDLYGWFYFLYFLLSFFCVLCLLIFFKYQIVISSLEYTLHGLIAGCILVQQVLVAFTSENLKLEGDRFVAIYQRKMACRCKDMYEFYMLAQQGYVRSPVISAAGFFKCNHALLYMLTNLAVSYVVVLVQFK